MTRVVLVSCIISFRWCFPQTGSMLMAFPGMLYEQASHFRKPITQSSWVEIVELGSTGILGFGGQLLKTFAIQVSRSLGVLVMR